MSAPPAEPLLLDRAQFDRDLSIVALRVVASRTEALVKALHGALITVPRLRPVIRDPADAGSRLVLLAPEAVPNVDLAALTATQRAAVEAAGPAVAVAHSLRIGYEQCSLEDVLRRVIPASLGLDLPSAFETAGHVAHVNLRDEFLPWRRVIAQAILDKNPVLRTVVQKTGAIHAQFRTYPMELLAGDDDTQVTVRECGATYRFDLARVYWNSRLGHEHEVLSRDLVPKGAIVADVFCGVGPFVIPLAMRGCFVHANDLNPDSFAALKENVRRNKVAASVACYNQDGRAFLRSLTAARVAVDAVVMNLPADALSFLDVFRGLYAGAAPPSLRLPRVHVYCFSKADDFDEARGDVARRLLAELGLPPPPPDGAAVPVAAAGAAAARDRAAMAAAIAAASDRAFAHANGVLGGELVIRSIRDVAPRKIMCCASFDLPASVATEAVEPLSKEAAASAVGAAVPIDAAGEAAVGLGAAGVLASAAGEAGLQADAAAAVGEAAAKRPRLGSA